MFKPGEVENFWKKTNTEMLVWLTLKTLPSLSRLQVGIWIISFML